MGRVAIKLSLVLGAVVIALLVAEFAIRSFPPKRFSDLPSSLFAPHPTLGRVMRPNYGPLEKVTSELSFRVETNSHGLRDGEIGPKARGVTRIIVLGDSFTWGDGVNLDETYVKRLETLLNGRCGRAGAARYEVINAGVPEWGPAQMWLYLKDYGVKFEPDLVLLGLFDLDIYRNEPYLANIVNAVSHPQPSTATLSYLSSLKVWLSRNSRLYNVIAAYVVQSPVLNDWLREIGLRAPKPREFLSAESGYTERVLKENQRILETMRELTRRRGIGFMAMYIPTAAHVEAIAKRETSDDRVARMMRDAFADAPASLVDLGPGLAAASRSATLYYPWDGHWTASGHRVAAEILWPYVAKLVRRC